jgi:hypothetical protein
LPPSISEVTLGSGQHFGVSGYIKFYGLMALMIGGFFAIAAGIDEFWPGLDSYASDLVAVAVAYGPFFVLRRTRRDLDWIYPDAPEAWATTRPATAATIAGCLLATVAFVATIATGTSDSPTDASEFGATFGVLGFVVVFLMEWISRLRQRRRRSE